MLVCVYGGIFLGGCFMVLSSDLLIIFYIRIIIKWKKERKREKEKKKE